MFVLIIIAILFLWVLYIRAEVLKKQHITLNTYKSVDIELKKQYTTIQKLFELFKNAMPDENNTIQYAEKLKTEVVSLGTEPNNIDRRIALDGELKKKTEYLISKIDSLPILKNNDNLIAFLEEYNKNKTELIKIESEYNSAAQQLKTAVDVFPYSFLARLNKVKSIDFIKY